MVFDTTVEELVKEIGHDGSEIIWPRVPEPYCRRGFHIQELIECGLSRNLAVVPIEPRPCLRSPELNKIKAIEPNLRMPHHMKHKAVLSGISNGKRHSVAWDGESIVDPSGRPNDLDKFQIRELYRIIPFRIGC